MAKKEEKKPGEKFFDPKEYNTAFVGAGDNEAAPGKSANLINLLSDPENKDLKHEALKIIKEHKGIELLTEAIKKAKKNKHLLIAACWEAGMDATEHFDFFLDLAIREDYMSAMEAITVIENMEGPFPAGQLKKGIAEIRKADLPESSDKYPLLTDLIDRLESRISG